MCDREENVGPDVYDVEPYRFSLQWVAWLMIVGLRFCTLSRIERESTNNKRSTHVLSWDNKPFANSNTSVEESLYHAAKRSERILLIWTPHSSSRGSKKISTAPSRWEWTNAWQSVFFRVGPFFSSKSIQCGSEFGILPSNVSKWRSFPGSCATNPLLSPRL